MKKLFTPITLTLLVIGTFTGYLYFPTTTDATARQRPAPAVVVETADLQTLPLTVSALGTANANESVTITAQETDIIAALEFEDGDQVEAGQVLVALNAIEEQARVKQLIISLKEAKRQLRRIAELAQENAASAQLLDEQKARVDSLKAQLEVTKSQVTDRRITAPFSGILGLREVSLGALVKPGDTITTLDDISKIKVDFSISEEHLPSITSNLMTSATSVAYPDQQFQGRITNIGSRIDPITRSVPVRALFDNPSRLLRPGMLLKVEVEKRLVQRIVVAESALVPIRDKQYVFRVNAQQVAEQVAVEIGERRPGRVAILQGLTSGDRVIVEGTVGLKHGMTVNPQAPSQIATEN